MSDYSSLFLQLVQKENHSCVNLLALSQDVLFKVLDLMMADLEQNADLFQLCVSTLSKCYECGLRSGLVTARLGEPVPLFTQYKSVKAQAETLSILYDAHRKHTPLNYHLLSRCITTVVMIYTRRSGLTPGESYTRLLEKI